MEIKAGTKFYLLDRELIVVHMDPSSDQQLCLYADNNGQFHNIYVPYPLIRQGL